VSEAWRLLVAPHAERVLDRLDETRRERIAAAFHQLALNPFRGDIRKMRGTDDEWRLRVGDWRIRFRRDD